MSGGQPGGVSCMGRDKASRPDAFFLWGGSALRAARSPRPRRRRGAARGAPRGAPGYIFMAGPAGGRRGGGARGAGVGGGAGAGNGGGATEKGGGGGCAPA